MTDLVVIVPSRNRAHAVPALREAFEKTCTADTELRIVVDRDDPTAGLYPEPKVVGGASSMVEALNREAVVAAAGRSPQPPFAVGFMGDDHRPRTKGWDARYLEELTKLGTGIVYGDDRVQGHRLPTQCAMTSDIIRTLGYMAPPELHHMYVDNAWLALGRAIGRITYLPDVVIEHLHPVAGTAEMDEGYARVNAPEVYARDKAVYERWLTESLPAEAHRVRTAGAL